MTDSTAPARTEVTTLGGTTHAGPLYPPDATLIRVGASDPPDPVSAAVARQIGQTGSVFLELPDGRLTVVLLLDGKTWVPRAL